MSCIAKGVSEEEGKEKGTMETLTSWLTEIISAPTGPSGHLARESRSGVPLETESKTDLASRESKKTTGTA